MGRDVVLAVGLVGICLGGSALFVRTAAASGGDVPVMPIVALIVLAAGVALARWRVAAGRRRSPALGPGSRSPVRPDAPSPYAPSAGAEAEPETVGLPEVGSGALDHTAVDADGFEHTVAALCARDGCPGWKWWAGRVTWAPM
ncbi:hypothetical protein WKI68_44165 [Streptomyces sp. MS1.HAVA.3]|uniref:Uncharacterized protein n=1 Tax=Streptomyces caledonius TaxID=3134107 RepID=A0ABU8UEQ6_9ACTN